MKVLIVAATETELAPLRLQTGEIPHEIRFAVHGPGLLSATCHLTTLLQSKPDAVLQVGIAGSFSEALPPGSVVAVESEQLGDAGAEDHERQLSLFDLGLLAPNDPPFSDQRLRNPHRNLFPSHLPLVHGLTVNLCTGSAATAERRSKMGADIETMEGAALHYVALLQGIPFLQLRGISNRAEPRSRAAWKIHEALSACHGEVIHLLKQWS